MRGSRAELRGDGEQHVRAVLYALQIGPLLGGMGARAAGTEDHGGNARRRGEGRVHPGRVAVHAPLLCGDARRVTPDKGDDRRVFRRRERVAHQGGAALGVEGGIAARGCVKDALQFCLDLSHRFAGHGPALDADGAPLGVAAHLLSTVDKRDVHGPRAQQGAPRARA